MNKIVNVSSVRRKESVSKNSLEFLKELDKKEQMERKKAASKFQRINF